MTQTLSISLPWPSKTLSPNARVHWRRVAEIKKLAKRDAFYATKTLTREIPADKLSVRLSFFPPDRRARDTDNMLSSMKAALDGISQAVGIDDSKWLLQIAPRGEPVKGGKVVVDLEWDINEEILT